VLETFGLESCPTVNRRGLNFPPYRAPTRIGTGTLTVRKAHFKHIPRLDQGPSEARSPLPTDRIGADAQGGDPAWVGSAPVWVRSVRSKAGPRWRE